MERAQGEGPWFATRKAYNSKAEKELITEGEV